MLQFLELVAEKFIEFQLILDNLCNKKGWNIYEQDCFKQWC